MMQSLPQTRDLVLIGGGHAHALVLLRWAMKPLAGTRLTLIDPKPGAPYTGMLPGHIAGHYPRAALEMDLVKLARHAGARLILGRVSGIDPVAQRITVAGRPEIAYDIASVDIGISSDLPELDGFPQHAVAAKPLGAYADRFDRFVRQVERGETQPDIAVIGAGVGGVELALAMAHRLRHLPDRQITLIERDTPLPQLGARARRKLLGMLTDAGITLIAGTAPASITASEVQLADGRVVKSDLTLGAAGARPQDWLRDTGLALEGGFITVDQTLRSTSHPTLFAAGDCAHMVHSPRPKAGVFAVRQAPILTHNLRAALSGGTMRKYRPQRDYLKLISLGSKRALADKWGFALHGRALWRLKDRIDAKFMRMFHALPDMPAAALPRHHAQGLAEMLGEKPLCGGCGAKVGPGILRAALSGSETAQNGLDLGIGDDAAMLSINGAQQVIATDHLRAVTEDPWLMAQIAAVHALGDIWAMGATPQAALASLILPRQSEPLQERMLAEIMDGLRRVLDNAGAQLAGGHTTMGAELTIGLTVTGLLGDTPMRTKGGAQIGDALILTKPIGSGVLLAAEMAKQAPGSAIAGLLPYLIQPQDEAARILAPVATAMTDVTGFGLAGHVDEMLRAGGVHARLDLASIPLFDGALEMSEQGVASTILPANRAALIGRIAAPQTARAALLFDPQTSGGLMASVAQAQVPTVIAALNAAGYDAAVIGKITAQTEGPALVVG